MINPEMFRITQINQSVVAAPHIGMNNRFDADTPANNGLERFSLDIRNNFSLDTLFIEAANLQNSELTLKLG